MERKWTLDDACKNHRNPWQRKIAFSYSDPGNTLEDKLNDPKPLFSRKKIFAFQKKLKKMLLQWSANLADQNKQQPQEINMCHVPYMTSQYETTFDRHMSILLDWPSQSGAAFAGERMFSKWRGLSASVSFLPLPLPPLFGSRFISRAVKTEDPLPWSFFAPKPNGNACYAGFCIVHAIHWLICVRVV